MKKIFRTSCSSCKKFDVMGDSCEQIIPRRIDFFSELLALAWQTCWRRKNPMGFILNCIHRPDWLQSVTWYHVSLRTQKRLGRRGKCAVGQDETWREDSLVLRSPHFAAGDERPLDVLRRSSRSKVWKCVSESHHSAHGTLQHFMLEPATVSMQGLQLSKLRWILWIDHERQELPHSLRWTSSLRPEWVSIFSFLLFNE